MTGYVLTWDERKERAKDLIAFLSAFDIPFTDAQNILSMAYQDIRVMRPATYLDAGKDMSVFAGLVDAGQKGITKQ